MERQQELSAADNIDNTIILLKQLSEQLRTKEFTSDQIKYGLFTTKENINNLIYLFGG